MAGVLCSKDFLSWLSAGFERYGSETGEKIVLSIVKSTDSLKGAGVEIKRYCGWV